MEMNEERARDILNPVKAKFGEYSVWQFESFPFLEISDKEVFIEGTFTLEEMEAIIFWIRNKKGE